MEARAETRRRDGIVAHLIDIAVAVLVVGVLFTWFWHYNGIFANPSGPVQWQGLAVVPLLFWLDLRGLAIVLARPEMLSTALVAALLIAAFILIVRSSMRRWLRILLHIVASIAFAIGTIAIAVTFKVSIF